MATLSKKELLDIIVEFSEQKEQFIGSDKTCSRFPEKISLTIDGLLAACQNIEYTQSYSTPLSVEEAAGKYATECVGEYSPELQQDWEDVKNHFLAGAAHREKQQEKTDKADLEYYPTGGINKDIVGDFFYAHKVEGATAEVQEFKNSDTRLSLMLVDNRVKAYVIETRTAFNNVMFVKGVVGNSHPTPIPSEIVQALEEANPYLSMEDLPWEPNAKVGYRVCLSKLRELLSSQPSQGSVQILIDALKYVINCGDSCHKCIKKCSEAIDEYSGNQPEKEEEKP